MTLSSRSGALECILAAFHSFVGKSSQSLCGCGHALAMSWDVGELRHPHRDMEIVTFIIQGSLTHRDFTGTDETIGRGGVQFMTAGTGWRGSSLLRAPVCSHRPWV